MDRHTAGSGKMFCHMANRCSMLWPIAVPLSFMCIELERHQLSTVDSIAHHQSCSRW